MTRRFQRRGIRRTAEVAGSDRGSLVGREPWRGVITCGRIISRRKCGPGKMTKEVSLIEGQNVVYSRDVIEGFARPPPLGHHATLAMPEKEGVVQIATSPIKICAEQSRRLQRPGQGQYLPLRHRGAVSRT